MDLCPAGDNSAADFDPPDDMDAYPEQPFMDDADMPADDPPNDCPGKHPVGAAVEPTGGHAAGAGEGLTGSRLAAAAGAASKASEDTAMPTPTASRTMQPVHPPSSFLTDHTVHHAPLGSAFCGKQDSAAAVQPLSGRPRIADLSML